MLDKDGLVPKVKLTSPWLQYLSYQLCGIEPESQSRHACVCTPYMFNKCALRRARLDPPSPPLGSAHRLNATMVTDLGVHD